MTQCTIYTIHFNLSKFTFKRLTWLTHNQETAPSLNYTLCQLKSKYMLTENKDQMPT